MADGEDAGRLPSAALVSYRSCVSPERIAELLAPFLAGAELAPEPLAQIARYMELLLRWNQRLNLTAVRDQESIVTRHFGESLFAARLLAPRPDEAVLDFGSGAGFPGLPLAIASPQARVTLLEAQQKKATFLREVVRALALENVVVFARRGEEFTGRAALVTLRAVERFATSLTTAAGLVEPGADGRLALLIGAAQVPEAQALVPALKWETPVPVPLSTARVLLVGQNQR